VSEGRFKRALRRLTADVDDLEAEELQQRSAREGGTSVAECANRSKVRIVGTVQGTTMRPLAGTPAVEAELYDGTGTVYLVWLGRREIGGIRTGVTISAEGRIGMTGQRRTMFNPDYTILPGAAAT
jgi:hypothetical protein